MNCSLSHDGEYIRNFYSIPLQPLSNCVIPARRSSVKGLMCHFQISRAATRTPSHLVLLKYLMTLIHLLRFRNSAFKEAAQIGSDFNSNHRQQRNLNMTTLNLMWSGLSAKLEKENKENNRGNKKKVSQSKTLNNRKTL